MGKRNGGRPRLWTRGRSSVLDASMECCRPACRAAGNRSRRFWSRDRDRTPSGEGFDWKNPYGPDGVARLSNAGWFDTADGHFRRATNHPLETRISNVAAVTWPSSFQALYSSPGVWTWLIGRMNPPEMETR